MRVLLEDKTLKNYDTRKLFVDVLKLFDEFNTKQFLAQEYIYKSTGGSFSLKNFGNQKIMNDSTWKSVVTRDKCVKYVMDFEKKIEFIKSQFTDDELIVFKYSLEEREYDKMIRNRIHKSEHKYYQIKKSCYLKIALMFGLVSSIEDESCLEITQSF